MSNFLDIEFKESPVYRLGRKRNGQVFRGTFKSEAVAVKKLSPKINVPQDDQHWEKLINLRNDQLVKYHQFSLLENVRYLVMELCQGSMVDYCRETLDEGVASLVKGIDIMWQIAYGLDFLCHNEISHGDLKLENVLFWKKNSESKLVFVKLTGYGYNNDQFEDNVDNTDLFQLGCLFYSAATKIAEKEPKIAISPDSLTEIDVKLRAIALDLINFLIDGNFPNSVEVGTLLRHPLFTRFTEEGRSRLKNDLKDEQIWNSEQMLKEWMQDSRVSLDEKHFPGELLNDFKDILLSDNKDITTLVDKAFKITPKFFSEYIWYTAITSGSVLKENCQTIEIEKQKVLGTGTYGKVYKRIYTDGNGNRYSAAFKKCKRNKNSEIEEKFDKEIETLRQLSHLFVVKYLDVVEINSKKFIVMELCDGSLKEYVEGKLDGIPKDSLDEKILISQVALGLAYIHGKGIIHKDLKLENILLKRESPRLVLAKIADFGFAKELKPGNSDFSKTTHPGTEDYMAPELLNAPDDAYPASFSSDIYALGITILRIVLKGKQPFSSNSIKRKFSMFHGLVPPKLQELRWDLMDLILKMIEKDPVKRPEMALVLLHPYFVLTNDRTKKHFVDQLSTSFKLLPQKKRTKLLIKIFNNRNFQEWYHSLSDNKPDTVKEMEEVAKTLQEFKYLYYLGEESLSAAKEYEQTIKEAMKSEYSENVGNKIDQINSIQGLFRGISRHRLFKLIERASKLIVPYFWSHFLYVSGEVITFRKPTSPIGKKKRLSSESIGHTAISELEWSSLYFDKEAVDELWNIKYSENYENSPETIQEIIRTVGKCNVSEKVWSDLLQKIEITNVAKLLYEVAQSNACNAPKVTEMILHTLQRFAANKENLSPVHILVASNEGDWAADIMQVLLNHGIDLRNAISPIGMTPAHYAAQNESSSGPKLMKLLLGNGGNPNTRSTGVEKSTPVHWAASNQGDYAAEILKLLVDSGGACEGTIGQFEPIHLATMNSGDSASKLLDFLLQERGIKIVHKDTGMSLVHFAMFNNGDCGPKISKKLLENRANPNTRDKKEQTPLHLAARDTIGENNQIAIMKIFLEKGGDPNAVDKLGRTPVHYAAANEGEYGHEKLKLLLDYEGKLSVRDKGGLAPIHYAILNKGTSGGMIRKLIGSDEENTNILLDNNSGETLLHRLVNGYNNEINLVQIALENGENPNAKDSKGWSPVHVLVAENATPFGLNILELLLKKGGDPNLPDNENLYTPIHYAASSLEEWGPKHLEIMLINGGDANAVGIDGLTPLHLAALNSGSHAPSLARILLEHKGNPNAADIYKRTSVHLAVLNENNQLAFDTTKQLLEKGGNPNAGDDRGSTPVHYTVLDERSELIKVTKLLIQHGGDILKEDDRGLTPYRLAIQMKKQFSLSELQ